MSEENLEKQEVVWELASLDVNQPKILTKNQKPIICPISPPAIIPTEQGIVKFQNNCSEACPFFDIFNEKGNKDKVFARISCIKKNGIFLPLSKFKIK